MSKKYLDLEGLQNVASKVNSRLKTVTAMPASASDGAIRLYVGETDANYTKGHIYQYTTFYEWRYSHAHIYTKSATPVVGDAVYDYNGAQIGTVASVSTNEIEVDGTPYTSSGSTMGKWLDISPTASGVTYDNTNSGLTADNVQSAIDELNSAVEQIPAGIVPKGTIAFASLPSLASVEVGWMYNISDDFTTTSDFITSGLAVKGNSCVYVVNVGTDNAPVLKWNIFANSQLDIEVVAYDDFDPTTIASNKVYLVY